MRQFDFNNAYLNGVLRDAVYVVPPRSIESDPDFVWKLKKGLYGLKEAGRIWNKTFVKTLTKIGFAKNIAEPCMYAGMYKGKKVLLLIHVDDVLVSAASEEATLWVGKQLGLHHKIRDEGEPREFLGVEFNFEPGGGIFLHQERYTWALLERLGYPAGETNVAVSPGFTGMPRVRRSQREFSSTPRSRR